MASNTVEARPRYQKMDLRSGQRAKHPCTPRNHVDLSDAAVRVVDAAEGLIQRLGYRGFSYGDIASILDISKPSVHHHFPTKEGLVLVVVQRYIASFKAALELIAQRESSSAGRLAEFVELFERKHAEGEGLCLCGILAAEIDVVPGPIAFEVSRFFKRVSEWLRDIVAAGQRRGEFRWAVDAGTYADSLLCALEGALVVGRGSSLNVRPFLVGRELVSAALT